MQRESIMAEKKKSEKKAAISKTVTHKTSKSANAYSNAASEYVQAYVPDVTELAYLLGKAKGWDRSMAEFSRICKEKGPSTFSRIYTGKIEKPVSDKLLIAIAENAADKSEVTLDKLMRANGKVPKEEAGNRLYLNEDGVVCRDRSERKKLVKDIIIQCLLEEGKRVLLQPDTILRVELQGSSYSLSFPSDFIIHIIGDDALFWNFLVDMTDMSDVPLKAASTDAKKFLSESMKRYAPIFLRDAWEPKSLYEYRNTFVFIEEKAYKVFCEMIKDVKFKSSMSAMYVDIEKKKIVDQKIFK